MCELFQTVNRVLPAFQRLSLKTSPSVRKYSVTRKGHYVLSGNLDPAMLNSGTPEQVRTAARELLELFRGQGGLMIGPGCALGPDTPSENTHALVEATKRFG